MTQPEFWQPGANLSPEDSALTPDELAALSAPLPKATRKPKGVSPTQRSLKHWRGLGYLCAVVEHWNPHVRIRQDLYGFIDILAIKGEDIVGVQATGGNGGNFAARIAKITEHENYPLVAQALRIVVQAWRKNAAGKWVMREVDL
jgi:hypothetical protein